MTNTSESQRTKPLAWPLKALSIAIGVTLIGACARVEVPMYPVPMTLQTLGVLVVCGSLRLRLGLAIVTVYLLAGAAGLPVFAGGASGWDRLHGKTAGYLWGFLVAAVLVGNHWSRSIAARRFSVSFALMLAGHAAILTMGAAWLSRSLGISMAIRHGVTPFLLGAVVKSALAAALVQQVLGRRMPRQKDTPEEPD